PPGGCRPARAGPSTPRRTAGPPGSGCRAAPPGRGPRRSPRGSPAPPWRCGRGPSACRWVGTPGWASRPTCVPLPRRSGARRAGGPEAAPAPEELAHRLDGAERPRHGVDGLRHLGHGHPGRGPRPGARRRGRLVERQVDAGALVDVAEDLGEVALVEGLLLDQRGGQRVERGPVGGEDEAGPVVRVVDEPAHLLVDEAGDLVGVGGLVAVVLAQEDLARLPAQLLGPEPVAHAV